MDPNENQRHRLNQLLSTEVDAQEDMITPADRDNRKEVLLQESRSNVVKNIENSNGDNTLQAIENPNGNNNVEDVTGNPCCQTSNQNSVEDINCKGETSYHILDNQMKGHLKIATGAIEQSQMKNTNEVMEKQLSTRFFCRRRVVQSSYSNEEHQDRWNTLWEKVERLNTMLNEDINTNATNASQRTIQRYIYSNDHQVADSIRRMREIVLAKLISEYHYFRLRLACSRPFLEHVQINSSREIERQRRLLYFSNRAINLDYKLKRYAIINARTTIIMNGYFGETIQNRLTLLKKLLELMSELRCLSQKYKGNEDQPFALDNALLFRISTEKLFDNIHRYRMTVSKRIVSKHKHLRQLFLRDRPFLDYMQINSSREAERQRRLRYYSNQERIYSGMVSRFCSIDESLNSIKNNYYDGTRQIPLEVIRMLRGLLDEVAELSAESVGHDDELPALD